MKKTAYLPLALLLPLLSLLLISWQTTTNDDWRNKVHPTLLDIEEEAVTYIVRMNNQADISQAANIQGKVAKGTYVFDQLNRLAKRDQASLINFLEQEGVQFESYKVINAILVNSSTSLLQKIAKRTDVAYLHHNPAIKMEQPILAQSASLRGPSALEWGIEKIKANLVWDMGYTGQDVVIAGQDTGYDWLHPALIEKYRGTISAADSSANHNYNWHDAISSINMLNSDTSANANPCGLDIDFPCDDDNHGTHTMGTMVGSVDDNEIGVAPGAKWIACRNMERGWGMPSTYIGCYEFFLAPTDLEDKNPDPTKAPHVINNSWSCPEVEGCDSTNWSLMEMVVNNLKTAGVVVVVSAGNSGRSGCSTVNTPSAIFENSFSIGATNSSDTIASFSSRGPVTVDGSGRLKPNVSAPGVGVRSSIPGNRYASFSGTSMAGPHVAGAVALIISANPFLAGEVEEIESILEQTALPRITDEMCGDVPGTAIPNNTYGYGRIDVLAAVEAALLFVVDTDEQVVDLAGVDILPNPVLDILNIKGRGMNGQASIELIDVSGSVIQTAQWQVVDQECFQIDVSQFTAGVYFYRVLNDDQEFTGKFIKQ